ncbi:hypothetical protein DPMN_194951 [Dreissena polymorpha]|uniref:Uncharacterized protein n=1 Tax=Dreissena polymorpha TaxID=45954 RepID=A0A9D4BET2_DREPO|nr:hypothetical protein DPMN_194951 [Dreissena polymorpha]
MGYPSGGAVVGGKPSDWLIGGVDSGNVTLTNSICSLELFTNCVTISFGGTVIVNTQSI